MMATTLTTFDVPLRLDAQGTIRVGQSRVTLDTVIGAHDRGASPEAIARQFPAVTLAELHGASAHSRQPQAELDASLRARLARQQPGGPHAARQLAIIMLNGRYPLRVTNDSVVAPGGLATGGGASRARRLLLEQTKGVRPPARGIARVGCGLIGNPLPLPQFFERPRLQGAPVERQVVGAVVGADDADAECDLDAVDRPLGHRMVPPLCSGRWRGAGALHL